MARRSPVVSARLILPPPRTEAALLERVGREGVEHERALRDEREAHARMRRDQVHGMLAAD